MLTLQEAMRVLWKSIKATWEDFFTLMLMNFVTVSPIILSVVLSYLMAELWLAGYQTLGFTLAIIGLLPLLFLPPAMAGLWNAANRVAEELAIHWGDYWEGFRRYFWKSLVLALINIVVLAILVVNVWFYAPGNNPWEALDSGLSLVIQVFFVILIALWLIYQMYPMAMLLEQTDQRLRTAFRNAGVLLITRPGFSILIGLALAVVIAISTYPLIVPWFLITLSLVAVVCNQAVKHLLIPHREQAAEAKEKEENKPVDEEEPLDEEASE